MHSSFFSVFEKHLDLLRSGCTLMFSTGKDSVCVLDVLVNKYGIKPRLCYWNMQPFLMGMHKSALDFYAGKYGVEYTTIPHYDRVAEIATKIKRKPPLYKEWLMKAYYDGGEKIQVFGIKDADSLTAKMICNKGARMNLHRLYPIYAWGNSHVLRYLEDNNVPLHCGYKEGFRDINEFNSWETLEFLKHHYPDDYSKLLALEPWRMSYYN